MKAIRSSWIVLFALSSIPRVLAQVVPSVSTIVSKVLVAGGYNTQALQGTVATGTTTERGTNGSVTIETSGSSIRYSYSLGNSQIVSVYASGSGWQTINGTKSDIPVWVTDYKRANHIPALSRLADANVANTVMTLIGVEAVNGSPAYHIRISSTPTDNTPADVVDRLSEFHIFVNTTSWLVVKTITFDFSPEGMNNRSQVDTYFSDYRNVNGIMLPFHLTSYVSNQVFSDTQFNSVQLGVPVSPSDFQ